MRRAASAYRLPWADLLRRVFDVDVLACARCGGRMTLLAFVHERRAVRRVLLHLGLPADVEPVERARGPPEPSFDAGGPRGVVGGHNCDLLVSNESAPRAPRFEERFGDRAVARRERERTGAGREPCPCFTYARSAGTV